VAKHFRELVAWQQAHALRTAVWAMVQAAPAMDVKLRSQITDAAGSICRNIAEGFRRRSHREFARYLEHATSSLAELEDGLLDAQMRGHVSDLRLQELSVLVRRTSAPLARLLRYMRHTPDAGPH
jgi:four helix bundle protein